LPVLTDLNIGILDGCDRLGPFGIAVAVPAVWMFNYFTNKVTSFGVEMENSASELVDYFIKQRTKALRG